MPRHRLDFTQAELNRMAEAAAKYGVPITVERVAPDGTVTVCVAKPGASVTDDLTPEDELERWRRRKHAC